ncbi:Hsp20/alpha crystallin family protein [Natronorarus salvus]|uniref:Hsp20/alpha crystallin family protein n=1 Tax=Natronorarus salvus TaxID=3117733 RepID=UPI002F26878D
MSLWDAGRSLGNAVVEGVGRIAGRVQESKLLGADLLESDEEFLLVFDAPGVRQSDVQVKFVSGEVHVRVDRFREFYEGFEMRFPGRGLTLDGRVELPDGVDVDPDAATARLTDHGTLHVRVPKVDGPSDDAGPLGKPETLDEHAGTDVDVGADDDDVQVDPDVEADLLDEDGEDDERVDGDRDENGDRV